MTDVHNSATRSYNMSRIRSKNTRPELLVRQRLFSAGFRFRIHKKDLPGSPDIVLRKYRTIIFIHGCFWHGHEGCKYFVVPKTRTEWWLTKIYRNKLLDALNTEKLTAQNWKVINIFECELKKDKLEMTIQNLIANLKASKPL